MDLYVLSTAQAPYFMKPIPCKTHRLNHPCPPRLPPHRFPIPFAPERSGLVSRACEPEHARLDTHKSSPLREKRREKVIRAVSLVTGAWISGVTEKQSVGRGRRRARISTVKSERRGLRSGLRARDLQGIVARPELRKVLVDNAKKLFEVNK